MPSNKSVEKAMAALDSGKLASLGLTIGKHSGFENGTYIPRADAQSAPELNFAAASADKTYMVVGLDLDAPFVSWTGLGPIWHWCQPGVKLSSSSPGKLESSGPFVANYIGPAPPPMSGPHRYAFFLYEQPDSFDVEKFAPKDNKPVPNTARMWYSLDDWEKKAGLGEVIAAGYFKSN